MCASGTIAVLLLGGLALKAQSTAPRDAMVDGIRDVERDLGYRPSGVFRDGHGPGTAFYYCYYTGKLTLPESYEGLRFERGTPTGCRIDLDRYDVFFYAPEAVASEKTPVTGSLSAAPMERAAVVISHEDFHVQEPVKKLPEPLAEAATTLVGFLTAAEYARRQYGEGSAAHNRLSGEADLFLRKAEVVNRSHDRLARVYSSAARREISEAEAISRKQALFRELREACESLPEAASFNRCPSVFNNAALAFDATYTRHYPLLHRVYQALGGDVKATVETIHEASRSDDPMAFLDRIVRRRP